uniref:Uncharacterized protein n=1 Tax=Amorphochlora amoebiformis TaxID=1561963 RepID=A0A7S0H7J7_9EUKA|mmetsp:Transcript_3641/g.5609  ORF Transcript_3641/g.5609 Transcript_3641/m.5609 type:complete len:204 (+) Transcript_3641:3-614(+)
MHGRVLERAQRFAFSLAMAAAMGITAYLFWKKHTQIHMPSHLSTSDPGKKERKSGKPKQSAERERQRQRQRQHKKRQRKRKKFRQEFIKDGTIRSLLGGEEEEGVELGGVAKQDGSLRTLPKGHRNFDMKLAKQALGKISWQKCPKSADPGGEYKEKTSRWISDTMGGLPPARAARKRCQIECIAAVLHKVLQHLNNSNSWQR